MPTLRHLRLVHLTLLAAALAAVPALGDDVAGAQTLLCATREVFACAPGGDCRRVDPSEIKVPDFVEVDLTAKQLRTTAASGEARSTAIRLVERQEGLLFLQGLENGRAWSFLVVEDTGQLTAVVAREELSVSVFGACTPTPSRP
jgi:hypothetical protein